jgi:hypothetical protein
MGDRANLALQYTSGDKKPVIYLYTHWGGYELATNLAVAIRNAKGRWSDDSYLARIIFSNVVTRHDLETGHGIAPFPMDNDASYPVLVVDLEANTVQATQQHGWPPVDLNDKPEAPMREAVWTFDELLDHGGLVAFIGWWQRGCE